MTEEPELKVGVKYKGVTPLSFYPTGTDGAVQVVFADGSVISFAGDAIVNAANEGCIGGGGVDGAINAAAGPEFREARHKLPEVEDGVRCPTGEAVVTIAGKLKSKIVIHAVGPMFGYSKSDEKTQLLKKAYQNSLLRAEENECTSIGFSLLSSGIFRGSRSLEEVLELGITAIVEYFAGKEKTCLEQVFLVGYTQAEIRTLSKLGKKIFDPEAFAKEFGEEEEDSESGEDSETKKSQPETVPEKKVENAEATKKDI